MTEAKTLGAPAASAISRLFQGLADRRPKGTGGSWCSSRPIFEGTPRSPASARPGRGKGEPPRGSRYVNRS